MKKLVILVILFIMALALTGYFALYETSDKSEERKSQERDTSEFRGPASQPSTKGPSGPPPGVNY